MDVLYVLWKYEYRQAHEAEKRGTYWALCIVLQIVMLCTHGNFWVVIFLVILLLFFFLQGVVIVLNKRSSMWNVRMRIKRVKIDRVCRQRQTGRRKRWIGAVSESDSFFFCVFFPFFFLVVDVFEPSYVNRGWKMEVKDGRRIRARTLEKMRSFEHSRRKHDHTVHTQKGTREERDNSNVTGKGARGRKWAYLVKARHSLYG